MSLLNGEKKIFSRNEIVSMIGTKNRNIISKILKNLMKSEILKQIDAKKYLVYNMNMNYNFFSLANQIDETSYISLLSVLEGKVIKQGHTYVFSISGNKNQKNIENSWDYFGNQYKGIKYYYSSIPQNFGIYIDENRIRRADLERAFLDFIYLVYLGKMKVHSELYLDALNQDKINKYLNFYPKFLRNFYIEKISYYAKR